MIKRLGYLVLVLLFVTAACKIPTAPQEATQTITPRAVAQIIVNADPNSTPTATPFQPIGPTLTPVPTETPIPLDTPAPQNSAPTPIEVYQPQTEGTVNLLVMGSDFRPSSGFRTDVIMLVSIHGKDGTVSVVSFPRDLYVTIPGWMEQRINTAFPHGGFSLLADTLETNFGVRPDFYVLTNFAGFTGIVDSLGGIKVNIEKYLMDKCDLPQSVNTYCEVNPGPMHMNGATALWYVRSRHSSSDFERLRRAQEVLYGLFNRLMSLDAVSHLPDLYSSYRSSVETNMSVDDMAPLLSIATQMFNDTARVKRYTIGPGYVYPYVTESGAQVLLPNYDAIRQLVREVTTP
jgi:polyisoprenyl-teichoic acid--peptidoglycan teichoic acid transferase